MTDAAWLVPTLAAVAVFVGAALQQLTGVGFALVVAPFLVLPLGPVEGVLLVNAGGALTSAVILAGTFREVDWRSFLSLAPPALVGVVVGALIVGVIPAAGLDIGVGVLVLLAIAVLAVTPDLAFSDRRRYAVIAGFASGAMNATAGLAGPAITVYGLGRGWRPGVFRSTVQAFFLALALAAIAAKLLSGVAVLPNLTFVMLLGLAASCLVGLATGVAVSKLVSARWIRVLLLVLSGLGGLGTLLRGALELASA